MPVGNMRLLVLSALLTAVSSRMVLNASLGCGKSPMAQPGVKTLGKITYWDPVIEQDIEREYEIYIPSGYHQNRRTAVLLVYHGWGNTYNTFRQGYHPVGEPDEYITLYLKGMGDYSGGEGKWDSWNCGNAGDLSSCTGEAQGWCYDSCVRIGKCSRCNSYTCVDDIEFTRQVLQMVMEGACVDSDRLYATGYSNGGQFIYRLAAGLDVFAAVMSVAGTPFTMSASAPDHISKTALLHYQGRGDQIIPVDGSVSSDGWAYMPVKAATLAWAGVHGCTGEADFKTPYDGEDGLACTAFKCPTPNSVVKCFLDGGHHAFPDYSYDFTWWYLSQFTYPS